MGRTRRKAWGAALAAVLVAGVVRAEQAPCEGRVRVHGAWSAVQLLTRILEERGLRVGDGCSAPSLELSSASAGAELRLRFTDAQGRTRTRSFTQPEAAAAWVESLTRADLRGPL